MSSRCLAFFFSAAGTQVWTADTDVDYLGCKINTTAAGTNVLLTTDATLTRAQFIAPASNFFSNDIVDYNESATQNRAGKADARVFLPAGTQLRVIASAAMCVLLYVAEPMPMGMV